MRATPRRVCHLQGEAVSLPVCSNKQALEVKSRGVVSFTENSSFSSGMLTFLWNRKQLDTWKRSSGGKWTGTERGKPGGRTERKTKSSHLPRPRQRVNECSGDRRGAGGRRVHRKGPEDSSPCKWAQRRPHGGGIKNSGPKSWWSGQLANKKVIWAECNRKLLHSARKSKRGQDKKGLENQQVYANFPPNILWVFAIRNNSVTTYVKGL